MSRLKPIVYIGSIILIVNLLACATGSTGRAGRGGGWFRPKGAPWTILCLELDGPYGAQQIDQIAETLRRTPGIRADDVFVRRDPDGGGRLYYGTYYRQTDPQTGKRSTPDLLRRDIELIKSLGSGPGEYFFASALVVRMPTPDVGNPAWALTHADGEYTLQVAAFEPTDEFQAYKQAAADYCALLRDEGFEAYYHHDSACSMVTVGSFGADAVKTRVVTEKGLKTVKNYYSPKIQALLRDKTLRYHHVNGAIHKIITPDGKKVPAPSRLVKIPRKESSTPW